MTLQSPKPTRTSSKAQATAVGPLWQNVRAVIQSFLRPKTAKWGRERKSRIKAGGRLCAPRPATPPRRAGRGFSIGGRNFNFLLWQVVSISKSREKTAMFRLFTRWLSQVVFRNFTGVSAGVIFYPLGASRGSVFPLPLQPPQYWRVKAGIFTNFRKSIMPGEKTSLRANLS